MSEESLETIRKEMRIIIHELMDRKISQQIIMTACCSEENRKKVLTLLKNREGVITQEMVLVCLGLTYEELYENS